MIDRGEVVKRKCLIICLAVFAASCVHFVPANWRAFEGQMPELKPLIISSLSENGLTVVADSSLEAKVMTQWQYNHSDSLTRERHRLVVYWKTETTDQAVVVYVQHENQSIESSINGGVDYTSIYPDQSLQTKILEHITAKIVNSSP